MSMQQGTQLMGQAEMIFLESQIAFRKNHKWRQGWVARLHQLVKEPLHTAEKPF